MNISKAEQRTLHALAADRRRPIHTPKNPRRIRASVGGRIDHFKDQRGNIVAVECISREGWLLLDCTLDTFRKLRKRRFFLSRNGGPYRVTREGLEAVRAQANNR